MQQRTAIGGRRRATISRSCGAISKASTRFASTNDGGWCFGGIAAGVRRKIYIWTITAMSEASHVDDEAQAGDDWRNSGRGIHEADRPDARRAGGSHGRATQARQ